ncbi:MAG: hypothetical protein J5855_05650 [Mailhella sp.]|nr:hypothetical protein [Mailhella sp.]
MRGSKYLSHFRRGRKLFLRGMGEDLKPITGKRRGVSGSIMLKFDF